MEIIEKIEDKDIELIVSGRLDTNTAPQLEYRIKDCPKRAENLYLNLSGIEYISSAGLRVVLLAHKLMASVQGSLIVKNPSPFCCQIFEATGMDSALKIEK